VGALPIRQNSSSETAENGLLAPEIANGITKGEGRAIQGSPSRKNGAAVGVAWVAGRQSPAKSHSARNDIGGRGSASCSANKRV
jgi:hypothetical protein